MQCAGRTGFAGKLTPSCRPTRADAAGRRWAQAGEGGAVVTAAGRVTKYDRWESWMVIRRLAEVEVMATAHNVDARNLYDTADAVITVITLQPGQALKRHITPVDVAFYVISGTGIVEIGDERQEVSEGALVESPRDIVHCWYNESDAPVRFMVVKAPRPTRKTVFVGT